MSASISSPQDIERFRLICLKQGLEMFAKFKMLPTRSVNATKLLQLASAATGKAYKRGEHAKAYVDVLELLQTTKFQR